MTEEVEDYKMTAPPLGATVGNPRCEDWLKARDKEEADRKAAQAEKDRIPNLRKNWAYMSEWEKAGVPFMDARQCATWGTYGPNGDQPLERKYIMDLSDSHILNILATQVQMSGYLFELMRDEAEYRGDSFDTGAED